MPTYQIKVNGQLQTVTAESDTPLLWVLRDHLNFFGVKYGCGIAQCGACTVHVNGQATRSCSVQIGQTQGMEITTIEGLSEHGDHPVQQAWKELDVPQCGYCQSGQIMSASALLKNNPNPTDREIRTAMQGNICRCASYNRIEKAIKTAAQNL